MTWGGDCYRSHRPGLGPRCHDIFRAREIADHVAIMDRGQIIMQQTATELAGKNLEEIYIQYMGGFSENPSSEVQAA